MKYCNDKEKTLIFIVFISTIAMMYIINNRIHDIAIQFIDDIVYNAKVRHVLRKCDECIEKQQKQQVNKENDDK